MSGCPEYRFDAPLSCIEKIDEPSLALYTSHLAHCDSPLLLLLSEREIAMKSDNEAQIPTRTAPPLPFNCCIAELSTPF